MYYILDENNIITNSIVLEDGTDPTEFGAIADERIFSIGDTWFPAPQQPSETELLRQQVADLQRQILAMKLGGLYV